MIYKAGAGPEPIPSKELSTQRLRDAIIFAISPKAKEAARSLGDKIREEVCRRPTCRQFVSQSSFLIEWSTARCRELLQTPPIAEYEMRSGFFKACRLVVQPACQLIAQCPFSL
jgi:hypothetical protein